MRNAPLFACLLYLLAAACATPTPPQGGPRDTAPPKVDSEQSTPNEQINFVRQPIEIAFDEWVQLEDAANQILVSPPLEFRPQVRIKKRSVIFEFDSREQLRANVTYAINFGTAVKDLTEKNAAENLRFVFSTGPNLDSLSLSGSIRDALTGEPVEKALFMLYDNLADSVVRRERPLYFGKTDKEGRFQIKNIRPGTFKGFALSEVNGNYRFDLPNEKIGFPDTTILISPDNQEEVDLSIFEEAPKLRRIGVDTGSNGLVKVLYNLPPLRLQARYSGPEYKLWQARENDTLFIWTSSDRDGQVILQRDKDYTDTLTLPKASSGKPLPSLIINPRQGERGFRQNPFEDFILQVSTPLKAFDTSLIILEADTLAQRLFPVVFLDSSDARSLHIRAPWQESVPYRLEIRPGAFTDIYDRTTDSSIVYAITSIPRKSYGNMLLNISGLDSTSAYVLDLVVNGSSSGITRVLAAGAVDRKMEFRGIFPQAYSLRLVEDRNNNGQWDSGSYEQRSQPERIFLFKLEPMRANWDLEAEVKLKE